MGSSAGADGDAAGADSDGAGSDPEGGAGSDSVRVGSDSEGAGSDSSVLVQPVESTANNSSVTKARMLVLGDVGLASGPDPRGVHRSLLVAGRAYVGA